MKVYVLSTCIPGESEPCIPQVFATAEEADAAFLVAMRDEWDNNPQEDEEGNTLPFPSDPQEAHDMIAENPEWGQWEITAHEIAPRA